MIHIRSIIEKVLPKGKFARSAIMLSGGTVIGQSIAIMASPFLTRLYGPSDFGTLAIFISILSVSTVVVSLKYQLAIPLPKDDGIAINMVVLSLLVVAAMTILTGLILFLFGSELLRLLNLPALRSYLWIIPISLLGAGIYQVLQYWAIRKEDFNRLARTKITQSVSMIATQLAIGVAAQGPIGLLVGDAIGRTSGSGTLAAIVWKNDRHLLKNISLKTIKILSIRYRNFPLISSFSGFVNSAGLQVAPVFLALFYGVSVVGWFSLIQRIIGIPMQFIGLSVGQVYISESARLARENPNELRHLFITQSKKLAIFGGMPIVILGLCAPLFFSAIFGASWDESGKYAQILSIMFAIQFIVTPFSQTLNILEYQSVQLMWDIGRLVLVGGGIYLCSVFRLSSISVIFVYSIIMSVAYILLFLLIDQAIKKYPEQVSFKKAS